MKNINKMIASVIAGVMLSTSAMATVTTEMKWEDTINIPTGCTFENRQEGVMNWNEDDSAFYSSTGSTEIASIIVTNIGGASVSVESDGKLWYRAADTTGEYQQVATLEVAMDYTFTARVSTIESRVAAESESVTATKLEVTDLPIGGSSLNSVVRFNIKGRAVVSIVNEPEGTTPAVDEYFPSGNNDYFIRHTITCTQ